MFTRSHNDVESDNPMSTADRGGERDGPDGGVLASKVSRTRFWLLCVLVILVWGAASWRGAEWLFQKRTARLIEREQEMVLSGAASVGANVGFTLAHMRSIPKVLARQPEIETILSRIGPEVQRTRLPLPQIRELLAKDPNLEKAAKRLESIVAELDIDQIWIINAAGDCVASGGFAPESTATGVNYVDREYFLMAKREGFGRQFAVGRTTNTPGIFYSAAVVVDDRFLGVVAVKIDVSRLSRMVKDKNIFITDENGVIIIAGDARLYMKAIPGAKVGQLPEMEQVNRYKQHRFGTLEITPVDTGVNGGVRMVRLEGHDMPMLLASSDNRADILTIWAFRDVSEVSRIRKEGFWVFVLLFLAGSSAIASVIAGVIHLRRSKEHQAEIARVNAELIKLNDELVVQARFDALTGCTNRRNFLEELDIELKRSARFGFSCALAMLDIDHFKQVNDKYGHATGDELLQYFSRTVSNCLRSSDLLGRFGGEEFTLLMPQTSLLGALELAERIRSAVESSSALSGRVEVRFTVSIGVVQWRNGEDTVEELIARADNAMYTAKHAGRNRVCAESVNGHGLDA